MDMLKKAVQEITSHYDKMGADAFIQQIENHTCPLPVEMALDELIHPAKRIIASEMLIPFAKAVTLMMTGTKEK